MLGWHKKHGWVWESSDDTMAYAAQDVVWGDALVGRWAKNLYTGEVAKVTALGPTLEAIRVGDKQYYEPMRDHRILEDIQIGDRVTVDRPAEDHTVQGVVHEIYNTETEVVYYAKDWNLIYVDGLDTEHGVEITVERDTTTITTPPEGVLMSLTHLDGNEILGVAYYIAEDRVFVMISPDGKYDAYRLESVLWTPLDTWASVG